MKEENYILFDQYLQDELSLEAKAAFEKQLTEDSELASDFDVFKELQGHLENKFGNETELNAFKANLKTISQNHFEARKVKVFNLKPWHYAAAASIALLFGLFFFNNQSNPRFEDYNQYENAYFTERGTVDTHLKQAEEAFNAKKYTAAVSFFEAVLKEKKTSEIQYFYGVSLLETDKMQQADEVFNELRSGNSIYKNKAIWSLAMSKLKQKEYKSCKVLLETIPSDYEDYDRVQELLKKLD
jgi:hypothetical protein